MLPTPLQPDQVTIDQLIKYKAGYRRANFLHMTSFYVTSFICQVHVCICNKFYMTSFHMTSFIYWCELTCQKKVFIAAMTEKL
jgi:hypothetical protein